MAIVQIESRDGVAGDSAASVDGIDVLFVGLRSLTHALGARGQLDHPFDAAIRTVATAATAMARRPR